MELLSTLLLIPLLTALLAFAARWAGAATHMLVTVIQSAGIALLLVFSLFVVGQVLVSGPLSALHDWMYVDALGAVFLMLIGVVGFLTGLYSIGYMNHEFDHGHLDAKKLCSYYGIFNLFVFTMLLAATANNIIMMWVAIEATTLGSVFLVGFYGKRSSLEAAWKYVIICTVGVAFGLYGVVLVYSNAVGVLPHSGDAAFWTVLLTQAKALDPTLMKLAFVFVLIGFGTKAGLFPMHAWLPDAHSEAPSPVSALLSAVLLNCAMLIVVRFYMIVSKTIGPAFPQTLLIVFGLMSVAVAAFFIIVQRDIKRLLAYSSVENMGLIALSFGIGGPLGVLAALFHTVNHSLAKALLFCGSGNVLLKYGTPDMDKVKGLLKLAPLTGVMLTAGALALGGVPPFNVFVSEFMVVTAGIKSGHIGLMIILLLLLTIVLAGLVRMVAGTVFGPAPEGLKKGETGVLTLAPMVILLALMLVMGIRAPEPVVHLLDSAARVVLAGSDEVKPDVPAPILLPAPAVPAATH
ncbi:hydrogenase 4 subunit F [Uliginosibacterium sp. 31-16]|uniref:hydrogenase 4 subunit F n=1 Tax=Uliginosibacterium sp. 31-16 TaxID=3068315 RepID=UPI00273E3F5D|nr:hydrogenase 4 subunit F [Uliginosibacterium sp. 31-16]MDP5240897.1 hydrogenase 4 subunit F [Uliginosibacterium sp. 31-16]